MNEGRGTNYVAVATIFRKVLQDSLYLSELAGLLVTGLKMYSSSKTRYIRYTRPILNGVNRSNTLHTKWPPKVKLNGNEIKPVSICHVELTSNK